ncbi:Uncharacterised protein [Acinetobacter baumannii]|nr:Uncharacterised protein [Acinetobacter baumannii]
MPSRRAPSSANRWLSESCTSSTEASVAGVFEWRDKGPSPEGEASAVKGMIMVTDESGGKPGKRNRSQLRGLLLA